MSKFFFSGATVTVPPARAAGTRHFMTDLNLTSDGNGTWMNTGNNPVAMHVVERAESDPPTGYTSLEATMRVGDDRDAYVSDLERQGMEVIDTARCRGVKIAHRIPLCLNKEGGGL